MWTHTAKEKMKKAAASAEIPLQNRSCLISEPQAAAAFVLERESERPIEVEAGDIIIVLDAGGGTTDAIMIEVVQRQPLVLKEIVAGEGDLCGSVFINEEFEKLLGEALEEAEIDGDRKKAFRMAMNDFEEKTKPHFAVDSEGEELVSCSVPHLRGNAAAISNQHFKREDIEKIFEKTVDRLTKLIQKVVNNYERKVSTNDQRRQKSLVKDILFVGGLPGSPYVSTQLRKIFRDDAIMGYPIGLNDVGTEPAAMARGALSIALNRGLVEEVPVRRSIGLSRDVYLNKTLHPNHILHWDHFSKHHVVKDVASWLVTKGQIICTKPGEKHFAFSPVMIRNVLIDSGKDLFDFSEDFFVSDTLTRDEIRRSFYIKFNLFDARDAMSKVRFGQGGKEEKRAQKEKERERQNDTIESLSNKHITGQVRGNPSPASLLDNSTTLSSPPNGSPAVSPEDTIHTALGSQPALEQNHKTAEEQTEYWEVRYQIRLAIEGTDTTMEVVAPPGSDNVFATKSVSLEDALDLSLKDGNGIAS
ncbi:MAG: hypothetical protein M1833_004761 [Piccolia ochrophora]|nr:MAG: hypothetical protein M1833_004761 [Piccolia ochrophora]